jgi:hypothetical protein
MKILPLLSAALAGLALNIAAAGTNSTEFLARGRIVNVMEGQRRTNDPAPVATSGLLWGFKTREGRTYVLQRGKFSEAIWLDERVRARELELRLRLSPKSPAAEVLALRSVKDGVVQDLYYYCDVCAIKSISPEPCYCCQGPVELVEKPYRGKPEE